MKKKRHKCSLMPYEIVPVVSMLEASQQYGWSVTAFDLPRAWTLSQGEGVTIAVLDSGCDLTHPDLVDNLLPGVNFVEPGRPPLDDNMHGTHITGILVAENNDIGMVGVAPKSKVIPIKVLDHEGNGTLENVAKAVRWAMDNGADIISMSLGAPFPIQQVRKAIQLAANHGIPIFVAAGNGGLTTDVYYPAAYPETIAVGSIDKNFDRSKFSNTGLNLDFMGPGGEIFSTFPNGGYGILSGTSMAAPFVAGVAALLLSYKRKQNLKFSLANVEDYRELLRQQCIPISSVNASDERYQGFGIVDPRKLTEWLQSEKQSEN